MCLQKAFFKIVSFISLILMNFKQERCHWGPVIIITNFLQKLQSHLGIYEALSLEEMLERRELQKRKKGTLRLYYLFPNSQKLKRNTKTHGRAPVWKVSNTDYNSPHFSFLLLVTLIKNFSAGWTDSGIRPTQTVSLRVYISLVHQQTTSNRSCPEASGDWGRLWRVK